MCLTCVPHAPPPNVPHLSSITSLVYHSMLICDHACFNVSGNKMSFSKQHSPCATGSKVTPFQTPPGVTLTWLFPAGSFKRLPGGAGEAPEEVLRQRTASRLSHPHVLGDSSQRRQLRYPGPEDAPGLGVGDRRGSVPGGGPEGPHAGEDQAPHLLRRSDVSRGRSGRDGHHRRPRALRHRTAPRQKERQRWEVKQSDPDGVERLRNLS